MQLKVVDNPREWLELADEWQALFQRCATSTQLFLDWHWVNGWWQHCGSKGTAELRCIVATQDGRCVLIWPWLLSRRIGLRVLEPMGGLLSCYDDALVDHDDEQALLRLAWDHLRRQTPHDLIELRGVHSQAKLWQLMQQVAGEPISVTSAPYIDIGQHSDYAAYIASRPKKMRQNQRRSAKYLSQQGEVSGDGDDAEMSIDEAIDHCLRFKRQWLAANGLPGKEIMAPPAERFLRDVSRRYQGSTTGPRLCISSLYLDRKVISVGLGFRLHERHCEYLAGFDHDLEHYGPGRLRMANGI